MAYKIKGNYHFVDETSTGIDKIPLGRVIEVDDFNGSPKSYKKVSRAGETPSTTISDAVGSILLPINESISLAASSVLQNGDTSGVLDFVSTMVKLASEGVLHSGTSVSKPVVTNMESVDFTVASNGNGYWLDRTVNQIKNDAGTVQPSGDIALPKFISSVYNKGRTGGVSSNVVGNGLLGVNKAIVTDSTSVELTNAEYIQSYDVDGVTLGTNAAYNASGYTYILKQEVYTHLRWGTTSQGKLYVEAYNPIIGNGIIYYIGSGLAGHQIPHSQDSSIDLMDIKCLNSAEGWLHKNKFVPADSSMSISSTSGITVSSSNKTTLGENFTTLEQTGAGTNGADNEYIMYYNRNTEHWKLVNYVGTGDDDNLVEFGWLPKDSVIKRLDAVSDWWIFDNKRFSGDNDGELYLNLSDVEVLNIDRIDYNSLGFIPLVDTTNNISGGQYIAYGYRDTNEDGGGTYYDHPLDGTDIGVTGGVFVYAKGEGDTSKNLSSENYTGNIDLVGVSQGLKYIAKEEGTTGTLSVGSGLIVSDYKPSYIFPYNKESVDDNRYCLVDNKWYQPSSIGELITNGIFDTDLTNWTDIHGDETNVIENEVLKITQGATDRGGVYQDITTVEGKKYTIKGSLNDGNNTPAFLLPDGSTTQNSVATFIATSTTSRISLIVDSVTLGAYCYFDNVSVFKTEAEIGTEVTTPISWFVNPIKVDAETPQFFGEEALSKNVMDDLEVVGDLNVNKGFNLNQKETDVTVDRAGSVDYINETSKPKEVAITFSCATNGSTATLAVGDTVNTVRFAGTLSANKTITRIVNPNSIYSVTLGAGVTISHWNENN